MRSLILFILLLFIVQNTRAQTREVDSLTTLIRQKKLTDTALISTYIELIDRINLTHPDTVLTLCNKVTDLINKKMPKAGKKKKNTLLYSRARVYNYSGLSYMNSGKIEKALECYDKSLKIRRQINDKIGMAESFNNIGYVYASQSQDSLAIVYFKKSLIINEEIKDERGIALCYTNMGTVYNNKGDVQRTLYYLEEGLKIRERINDSLGIAYSLNNRGTVLYNMDYKQKAMPDFLRCLAILEKLRYTEGIARSLENIADIYFAEKDYKKAVNYGERALQLSRQIGYPELISKSAIMLANTYVKLKRHDEAYEMFSLHVKMNDSINNEENRKTGLKRALQYEYDVKAATDSIKSLQEKKLDAVKLEQEKTFQYALYAGLVLVFLFGIFMVNRLRIANQQKKLIDLQKQEVELQKHKAEMKQSEIIDSIRYAKRIQFSRITNEKYIQTNLKRLKK